MAAPERPIARLPRPHSEDETTLHVPLARHRARYLDTEVIVRPSRQWRRDAEVARAVVSTLQADAVVPAGTVWVAVRDGWVTLKGQVEWEQQRTAAGAAARHLAGVRGVINSIVVTSSGSTES